MLMTERQKEKRRSTFGREMTDIGVGISIVILSVLVFLNPDANRAVFPVIFLLGAGLCLSNALSRTDRQAAGGEWRVPEILLFIASAALFLMAVMSAASILWG